MELKPGYKQTEVGVIPEEWEVDCVGNICSISVGRDLKEQNYSPVADQKYRFPIYSNTVENFGLYGYYDFAEYQGESLTVVGRGIGLGTAFARSGGFGAIGRLLVLFPNSKAAPIFLAEYINFFVTIFDESSGIPQLTGLSFAKYKLPLPPLPEQRAIATALSDVDALIASLDKLIAKKRDMKQAAMQELLTGKRRLAGFSGEWEVKRLGDCGTFLKGSGVKKDETRSGNLPCVRYGEIYTHHNDYIKSFNSWISAEVAATATRLKQGDLLFTGSGETKEEIGKCVAFVGDFETYAGGDIVILRLAGANPMFMGYYCNTPNINSQKASKGQGDAVVHISASALSSITAYLPSLPEQTAIAAILSDMDTEIAALEQKRDKTRLLKQGMMQELLTGRIRLV